MNSTAVKCTSETTRKPLEIFGLKLLIFILWVAAIMRFRETNKEDRALVIIIIYGLKSVLFWSQF